jgi:hypothetical protein
MTKIFGLVIFIFGLLAVYATYNDILPFWFANKPEQIRALWKQDMELLIKTDKLPKEWGQIREIKLQPLTATTAKLIKEIQPPIAPTKKDGNYRLEISLDDWKEKSEYGLMLQYQLFDLKTQNLIWELDRTLLMNEHHAVSQSPSQSTSK